MELGILPRAARDFREIFVNFHRIALDKQRSYMI